MSNDVDREVILDTMEVLWRSMEISNGLYNENNMYPTVMRDYKSLHNLCDIISKWQFYDIRLSDVEVAISIHDMGKSETEYDDIVRRSEKITS